MRAIPSALLIIRWFLIFSEARSARFSNKCKVPRIRLPENDTKFKLSVGTDYNQLNTIRSKQFYEGTIQNYAEERPKKKILGMKYFKIKHKETGKFLNIQFGSGINPWGYLAVNSDNSKDELPDAIFTLHQLSEDLENGLGALKVRCVSQCNGWEGYYLSYTTFTPGAVGYVFMSANSNFDQGGWFIVGNTGELAFSGPPCKGWKCLQNPWYLKHGWIQTSEENNGDQFILEEIEGPKTFLKYESNGEIYTTNKEKEASEFVMMEDESDGKSMKSDAYDGRFMKCVKNCSAYEDLVYKVKDDDHGRISLHGFQLHQNGINGRSWKPPYRFWYFVAAKGGWSDGDDYLSRDYEWKHLGQEFCVELPIQN